MRIARRFMLGLLALCGLVPPASALTLQWDVGANWPPGTTVEACFNASCVSGISGTEQFFDAPPPGTVIDARARAHPPAGYLCGDPPVICPPSDWETLLATLPADQSDPIRAAFVENGEIAVAAPTFVAQYVTVFNTDTTPKTAMNAVAISSGDVLVAVAASEMHATLSLTETGAGSATLRQSSALVDYSAVSGWTYVAPSNETVTVSFASNLAWFGGNVVRFSGSGGIGASAVATGASGSPSVSLTTTQANSAIVVIVSDWNATAGTQTFTTAAGTPTALTDFPGDAAHYGVAIAYYADVGAIGSKTVGMSAPTGQKWSIIAIEVKGTAGNTATSLPPSIFNYANLLVR